MLYCWGQNRVTAPQSARDKGGFLQPGTFSSEAGAALGQSGTITSPEDHTLRTTYLESLLLLQWRKTADINRAELHILIADFFL